MLRRNGGWGGRFVASPRSPAAETLHRNQQDQASSRTGSVSRDKKAAIHRAATAPSIGRWSTESVTWMTVPTVSFPLLTTGSCRAAPTCLLYTSDAAADLQ